MSRCSVIVMIKKLQSIICFLSVQVYITHTECRTRTLYYIGCPSFKQVYSNCCYNFWNRCCYTQMGMFTETAIVDYRLSFADHGKELPFSVFHLQQTNGSCCFPLVPFSVCRRKLSVCKQTMRTKRTCPSMLLHKAAEHNIHIKTQHHTCHGTSMSRNMKRERYMTYKLHSSCTTHKCDMKYNVTYWKCYMTHKNWKCSNIVIPKPFFSESPFSPGSLIFRLMYFLHLRHFPPTVDELFTQPRKYLFVPQNQGRTIKTEQSFPV